LVLVGLVSAYQLWRHHYGPATPPTDDLLLGIVLAEPKPLKPFKLLDHHGETFDLERLKGKWSFIFFGYTSCPDVCPLSMSLLAQVYERLEKTPEILADTRTYFISVDPKRDRLEILKSYVPYYHADFIGVTGSAEALRAITQPLHTLYEISSEIDANGNYNISHTSAFYLIDPTGRFYALFQSEFHDPKRIAEAFIEIKKRW